MRKTVLLVLLAPMVSCEGTGPSQGDKEAVVLESCESVSTVALDEGSASADLLAAVEVLDGLAGAWSATDGCTDQTIGVEISARDAGDVQTFDGPSDCEALALADADLVLEHPDLGTLTFAMSGTLNAPDAWNTVDLSGTAGEDESVRLSVNVDGEGTIVATMLVSDVSDDASCLLEDWSVE